MASLKTLADNRTKILLAELVGWLHDMGKCTNAFEPGAKGDPYKAVYSLRELKKRPYWGELCQLVRKLKDLQKDVNGKIIQGVESSKALYKILKCLGIDVQILDFDVGQLTGRDLILWGRPFICKEQFWKTKSAAKFNHIFKDQIYLLAYLGRAHAASHIEKEEPFERTPKGVSIHHTSFISTPFGWDFRKLGNLDKEIRKVFQALGELKTGEVVALYEKRVEFLRELERAFSLALGDDRYPDNEVTLWDWSVAVASLYKAAIAGALLGWKPYPNELHWRLLSVRFDGLGFLSEVHRIPDLLGRKKDMEDALDEVRKLLEFEYPLGMEVYRDENGSIFVIPGYVIGEDGLQDVLSLKENEKSLEDLIREKFLKKLYGEIVPHIKLDPEAWYGQAPKRGIKDKPPSFDRHLEKVTTIPDVESVSQLWGSDVKVEVCTACGLRPQGPSRKAKDRHVCDVCLKRREDRASEWLQNLYTTIWIDEVADINARVALIVGRFDLQHWLGGPLVNTLAVADPAKERIRYQYKTVSFVRMRRIWDTTRRFWQEVLTTSKDGGDAREALVHCILDLVGPRLFIAGELKSRGGLHPFHAYDLVLTSEVKVSVLWTDQHFITCDNLEYLESRLGHSIKEELAPNKRVLVEEPTGYGERNRKIAIFEVAKTGELKGSMYIPAIPILAEPQSFMAVVPANRTIEIIREIKRKYEREMGKVRNRLPLHLGIVFAHRRTPLRAILDAGRRLLQQHFPAEGWTVVCASRRLLEREDPLPQRFRGDGENHFQEWFEVLLQREDRELTWYAPARMGDGQTPDVWYPYVFLNQTIKPTGRRRTFKAQNPWTDEEHWLVHVEDLKPGDEVFFTPATLDWVWLDTNARRFEIAYDEQGQRRSLHLKRRPYLLDELETLEYIWQTLEAYLSRNQIHILRETIEAKREEWGYPSPYDETFRRFCRDLLAEAEWQDGPSDDERRKGKKPWEVEGLEKSDWLEKWAGYAARGWLADAVELYWEILKGGREREEEPVREVERT